MNRPEAVPFPAVQALVAQCDLTGAIELLNQIVRTRPTDASARTALFELLAFTGAYDRADRQVDVLSSQAGPGSALAMSVYRGLVEGERVRRAVFSGTALPKFVVPPPRSVEACVLQLRRLNDAPADARDPVDTADGGPAAVSGRLNGEPFAMLRDADDRVAPVLEAFHGRDYLWLPFEQLRRIELTPPSSLRDVLWVHARVALHDGETDDVFIPSLYVNSDESSDPLVRMGRATDWRFLQDRIVCGAGQRTLLADDRDVPLLQVQIVEFDAPHGQSV